MSKVLIIVDMQNDFISGSLGSEEAQKIVPIVNKKIEEFEDSVVYFTMDTHYDDYLETPEGKALPVPHCIEGTWGHKIHNGLANPEKMKQYTFQKENFGSLYWLDIPMFRDKTVEVELCGLCTDICVITNALIIKTAFPHITVTVDANACAGVTPESHKAALLVMKMCQINVLNYPNEQN